MKPDTDGAAPGANEIGTIRKSWRGRTTVALVYPNRYHVGMSNLGLQSVYGLLNGFDDIVCERVFLPEDGASAAGRLTTLESGRPVAEADIVAFSISFESDYPHLLALLERAKIPLLASQRDRAPSPGDRRRGGLFPEPGTDLAVRRRLPDRGGRGDPPAVRGGVSLRHRTAGAAHDDRPHGARRLRARLLPRDLHPRGDHRRV